MSDAPATKADLDSAITLMRSDVSLMSLRGGKVDERLGKIEARLAAMEEKLLSLEKLLMRRQPTEPLPMPIEAKKPAAAKPPAKKR